MSIKPATIKFETKLLKSLRKFEYNLASCAENGQKQLGTKQMGTVKIEMIITCKMNYEWQLFGDI